MASILKAISHSENETLGLAEKIGLFFKEGDVVILSGELGAGKTLFVKGVAKALGIDTSLVNSPSYTIVNEYRGGSKLLFHFDLYRLGDISELYETGWDDYMQQKGIMVIEWGEKGESSLPIPRYQVSFKILDDTQREIDITVVNNE
ncbi:MAG: tRNA (adenosine(37)-N6)-threonylcarbamoyltransferase complex ATPase subunit type 1 TsaE [bacterium]